jgi:hypothetical protein
MSGFDEEQMAYFNLMRGTYDAIREEIRRPQMRRLEFARWLTNQGIINEGMPHNGTHHIEGYEPEMTLPGIEPELTDAPKKFRLDSSGFYVPIEPTEEP